MPCHCHHYIFHSKVILYVCNTRSEVDGLLCAFEHFRKLRATLHGKLLINLSSALLGLYITFLIAGHVTSVPPLCGIIAALIHYFMLVFFGWTAVEAVYLYTKLVIVLGKDLQQYTFKTGLVVWCTLIA